MFQPDRRILRTNRHVPNRIQRENCGHERAVEVKSGGGASETFRKVGGGEAPPVVLHACQGVQDEGADRVVQDGAC